MRSKTELRDTLHIFDILLVIFSFFNFFLKPSFSETAGGRPVAGHSKLEVAFKRPAGRFQKKFWRKNQNNLKIEFLLCSMVF